MSAVALAPRRPTPLGWSRPRPLRLMAAGLTALGAAALAFAALAGFLDQRAIRMFAGSTGPHEVAALYMSGDMGLRFGMGPHVAPALARQGIPVMGLSSSTLFGRRRTLAEVRTIVADGAREALRRTGARKLVLIGQSFGSDMIATALPALPADLREQVAAVVLVVPGDKAYFRADPLGFAYRGPPDAEPAAALREVRWTPIVCIRGAEEKDSLCPELAGTPVRSVTLPGGHFLKQDHRRLVAAIMDELRAIGAAPRA